MIYLTARRRHRRAGSNFPCPSFINDFPNYPLTMPTAFGITTSFNAITPPIGIPFPAWVSGIRHTHLWIKGSCDRWYACSSQLSSNWLSFSNHTFTGNLVFSLFSTNISSSSFPHVFCNWWVYYIQKFPGNHFKKVAKVEKSNKKDGKTTFIIVSPSLLFP